LFAQNITGSADSIANEFLSLNKTNRFRPAIGTVIACHNKDPEISRLANNIKKQFKHVD